MNDLNIGIKKALITRVSIELGDASDPEKRPSVTVSGKYLTAQNREVSDFLFYSPSYTEDRKLEITQDIYDSLQDIFARLTPIVYDKVMNLYKVLPEIATVVEPSEEGEVAEEKEEEELDPDEIPF